MGRSLMYTALGALMLLVLSSFFLLEHGGEQLAKPGTSSADNSTPSTEAVSLHDLTTSAGIQKYGGKTVSTSGTLYFNSSTNKHVIVNGNENYPVVIDWSGKLGVLEGKRVLVTGTFNLVPGSGPTIDAVSVQLDGSPTPTPKNI